MGDLSPLGARSAAVSSPSSPPPFFRLLLLFASICLFLTDSSNAQFLRDLHTQDKEGANAVFRVQGSLVYSTRLGNDANARSLLAQETTTNVENAAQRNDFLGEAEQEVLRSHRILSKLDHYELHDLSAFFKQREELKRRRRLSNTNEELVEESLDLDALGQRVTVSFSKFTDLFGAKFSHKLVDRNMNIVRTEPALDCFYRARGENMLRGSIALCKDQEMIATFFGRNDEEAFGIKPVQVLGRNLHAVYLLQSELKDLLNKDYPVEPPAVMTTTSSRIAGDGLTQLEGAMANSVATPYTDAKVKYAGIMQVNDKGFYTTYEVDTQLIAAQVMAGAKVYYDGIRADAPYRVIVEMSGMITFTDADPWTQPKTSSGGLDDNALLSVLTTWKNQAQIEADIVHFLIGTAFTEAAGWGFVGTACGSSNVGETMGLYSVSTMAAIAAHEIVRFNVAIRWILELTSDLGSRFEHETR